jgi:zinc protease
MVQKYLLDNKLRVIFDEVSDTSACSIQVWIEVGSADEEETEAGYSHFIEHMLFKGSKMRGVGEIAKEIESLGGDINAFTSFDQTVYKIDINGKYIDNAISVLSDMVCNPLFSEDEISNEKKVVLEEIKRSEDSPSQVSSKQLFSLVYEKHPYRRPVIGFESTIKNLTRSDLINYYNKWYTAQNIVVSIVGNFRKDEITEKIAKAFKKEFLKTNITRNREIEPIQDNFKIIVKYLPINEVYLNIAYPSCNVYNEDSISLDILSIILGQGESSRLFKELKIKRQCVNSIASFPFSSKDSGLFITSSNLSSNNFYDAIKIIFDTYEKQSINDLTITELDKARLAIERDMINERETTQGLARKYGFFEAILKDYHFDEKYLDRIRSITLNDLKDVFNKYFNLQKLNISICAPEDSKEKINNAKLSDFIKNLKSKPKITKNIIQKPILYKKLNNNIRVILKENKRLELISIKTCMLGGLRYEDEKTNGISHFTASMLTRSSKNMDTFTLAKTVEEMGSSIKGVVGKNSLMLSMEILARYFKKSFEIFTDVLLSPSFNQKEFEFEKENILESIKIENDYLPSRVFNLFSKTLYKHHPYKMNILGCEDTIKNMDARALSKYYENILNPNNMVISIVGDFESEEAYALIEENFSRLQAIGKNIPKLKNDLENEKVIIAHEICDKMQAHIVVGWKGMTFSNKDKYALEIASSILAGQSGRLFLRLRDEKGLAYAVTSVNVEGIDPGYFAIYIATSPENINIALAQIKDEIMKLRNEEIKEEEITRAKNFIIGNYELELQHFSTQATMFAYNELYNVGYNEMFDFPLKIASIKKEEIHDVILKYLQPDKCVIAIIKPENKEKIIY